MLALRKTAPAVGLTLDDISQPRLEGAGDVVVAVAAAGICGSDVHAFEWTRSYQFMANRLPRTLGHEFAGRIVAVGAEVDDLAIGDAVAVSPMMSCGRCASCRAGRLGLCENRQIIGFHRDGAFAGYVVVPGTNCFKLPRGVDLELAALAEPLSVAANAVDVGGVRLGETVVVLGAGPIGLGMAWMARRAGAAQVLLVGLDDAPRLAVGVRMGLQHTADLKNCSLADAVRETFGQQVDVVFEATGAPTSLTDGLAVLRPGGTLVTAGIFAAPVTLDLTPVIRRRQQIRAAYDSNRDTWLRVLALLAESGEELRLIITHRLPLGQAIQGFALARSRAAAKIILQPAKD